MTKHNKHMLAEIKNNLQNANIQGAMDTLSHDHTAFGNVVREGVQSMGRPIPQIESKQDLFTFKKQLISKHDYENEILGLFDSRHTFWIKF